MQGAKDLLDSERGWFVLATLTAATVLVALNKLTGADWRALVMVLGGMLVASKTIRGSDPVPTQPPTASS